MARIGNEAKLILKLAREKSEHLKDQRIQTPDLRYIAGYGRCFDDIWGIIERVISEIES